MNIKPIRRNQSQQNQQQGNDNFIPMDKWLFVAHGNEYIKSHLEAHPEKLQMGFSEDNKLYIMILK